MSLLKDIQQKPESVRKRYVFGGAILITLIIVLLWIPTFGSRFKEETRPTESDAPSPIGSFVGTVKSLFSGFSYEAEQAKQEVEEVKILIEGLQELEKTASSSSELVGSTTEQKSP